MGNLTVKESGEMASFISPNVSKITSFKVHFSPRQEGSGDPSPENVREITGWNGVEGYNTCDINLFNYTSDEIKNGYRNNNGDEIVSSSSLYTVTSYPVQPNQQLFISSSKNDGFSFRLYYLTQDEQWIRRDSSWRTCTRNYTIITIPLNCYKIQLQFTNSDLPDLTTLQIRIISTTTTDWTEDVGTVYGGYVDLISGELVQTIKRVEFTWGDCEDATVLGNTERRYIVFNDNRFKTMNNLETKVSNIFSTFLGNTSWNVDEVSCVFGNNTIICKLPVGSDNNTIIQIAGDLATPITHQLTPQQLSTLKGQNNFWSNADYIEIEYELTETFDIQKAKRKIILNQPHVESASGDIVTFDTDMKGKLKECKVYFSPVQEGEGDPSPDNVRNITGWDGVSVGLPSEYQEVEYIESTGTQYIVTDIVPNYFNQSDFYIKCALMGLGTKVFFGINNFHIGSVSFQGVSINLNLRRDFSGYSGYFGKVELGEWFEQKIENGIAYCVGTSQTMHMNDSVINTEPLAIFSQGDKEASTRASVKIQSVYFDDHHGSKINLIPCYRKSDDEIGMYDTVSQKFFTNQGTGTFLKGADVNRIHGSIDWTNDVGTVYGGYVDLVSGELVQTHYKLVADGINRGVVGSTYKDENRDIFGFRVIRNYFSPIGIPGTGSTIICDSLPILYNKYQSQVPFIYSYSNGNRYAILYCGKLSEHPELVETEDYQAFVNAWLVEHPLTFVYKLETPIHYQLTPQQLITLRGINTIYSNTNGRTEIKYWKH